MGAFRHILYEKGRDYMLETIYMLDTQILLWIQDTLRQPALNPFMKFLTSLGDSGSIWIFLALFCLFFHKTRKGAKAMLIALLLSFLVNNLILKRLFGRIRPYDVIEGLTILIHKPGEFSFPSGHTASSFGAATAFYLNMNKKWGAVAICLAAAIGFTRMYVGVHYPTDVLGGMVSGIFTGILSSWIVNYNWERKKNHISKKGREE